MFSRQDKHRDEFMLNGSFAKKGYDWWWHSFTAVNAETGEEKPFFVEFFTINPALGGKEPVLGQLPENKEKGIKPSYLMVKAGAWGENHLQLHRFFGWDDVKIHAKAPYSISSGDCHADDYSLQGHIKVTAEECAAHPEWMCDAGEIYFNLTVDKRIAYNVGYGADKLFRDIKAFEMYWHAEGIKTFYEGTITLNGVEYTVKPESCYGYADKNWGRGFTTPWVWLSSNDLTDNKTGKRLENSVFEIGGGRPKVFFVPLERKLLGGFYYEGKEYEFNFSKFWTGSKTDFSSEETENEILWHVRQENNDAVMETEVRCFKKDMLLVNYEAPDGSKRHNRLWNGGNGTGTIRLYEKSGKALNLIADVSAGHIGCEYGEYDK